MINLRVTDILNSWQACMLVSSIFDFVRDISDKIPKQIEKNRLACVTTCTKIAMDWFVNKFLQAK